MFAVRTLAKLATSPAVRGQRSLCSAPKADMEAFVKKTMEKYGLAEHSNATVQALNQAMVINTDLMFRLTDADWKETGIALGAVRALKDEIAEHKIAAVQEHEGQRSRMRREQSMKEKRKF